MKKIWFVEIAGKREGPYSVLELQRHPNITPNVLAWREGFSQWIPIRLIPELQCLFKEEEEPDEEEPAPSVTPLSIIDEEMAMTLGYDPSFFYFWLLIITLLVMYYFYRMQLS